MNKIIIIGNLGKDPEVRELTNGKVATFSVATTERWRDKSGERKEETDWHNVVVYGKLSEVVEKYLRKGSKVCVEGRIRYRKYEAKDGTTKYITELLASHFEMLDVRKDAAPASHSSDDLAF